MSVLPDSVESSVNSVSCKSNLLVDSFLMNRNKEILRKQHKYESNKIYMLMILTMYIKGVCSPNPCVNGGNCQVVDGDAICRCPDGFVGEHCELGI